MHWFRIALVILLTAWFVPAQAQEDPSDTISVSELENLVSTLENETKRGELVTAIKGLIAVKRESMDTTGADSLGSRLISTLAESATLLGVQVSAFGSLLSDIPLLGTWLSDQVANEATRKLWLQILFNLGLLLAAGFLAEGVTQRLLRRPRSVVQAKKPQTLVVRIPLLVVHTILDIVPYAAFAAASYAVLPLTRSDPRVYVVAFTVINANLVARGILAFSRAILVPSTPTLRILPIDGETANYLYIWVRRFVYFGVVGYFGAEAALLLGLPFSGYQGVLRLVGLIVAAMAVVFVLQNRTNVAQGLRGDGRDKSPWVGALRSRIAAVWHALVIVYIFGIYGVWTLGVEGGFEFIARATLATVVIFMVARLAMGGLRRLVERAFAVRPEVLARFPRLELRANRYMAVLHAILRAGIYFAATMGILQAWGFDAFALLESPLGTRFFQAAITIAIAIFIALLVWESVNSSIENYLNRTDDSGSVIARSARARTLLPLLRNALLIMLAVLLTLIILSEIGIDIAPLLAGAGVVGLAIGFGSQKLVQDVITGAFILFEDTMSVGDVATVGGLTGVVEAMSIRSIRLRDMSGNVHTVPFSAVSTVTNMTKEFSFSVFEIGIAYREDVDDVMQVLRELGAEMQKDPEFGPLILEPLDILGLDSFGDSAVVIKARFKTIPIKQWAVGREFNRRMKRVFDERGIEIPFPHTTIYFGEDKAGNAPPAHIRIGEAAARPGPVSESAADQNAESGSDSSKSD